MLESKIVSVVIPTYNRANVIQRAVDSVLVQTYKNIEIIIIDDGSTDNTKDLVKDLNVKYIKTDNMGVSAARNLGVKLSSGDWIAFLDSDDEWLPSKLEEQINFSKEHPNLFLIHTDEIWIRNGIRVNPPKKYKKEGGDQFIPSLKLCAIGPSTSMIKKDIFLELGGFREDLLCCEDYDLWLKFTSLYEVGFVDKLLVNKYGGHDDQLSTQFIDIDYYRILSISWILENRKLSSIYRDCALKILKKKCEILIKGYIKHSNLKNLNTVQDIYKLYFVG
jgi:glycosyltransferase involved in cell wall biosynthesis